MLHRHTCMFDSSLRIPCCPNRLMCRQCDLDHIGGRKVISITTTNHHPLALRNRTPLEPEEKLRRGELQHQRGYVTASQAPFAAIKPMPQDQIISMLHSKVKVSISCKEIAENRGTLSPSSRTIKPCFAIHLWAVIIVTSPCISD